MKHIAEGGSDTKLNQGGTEAQYSGIYVPTNKGASTAYMNAGRYDNLLTLDITTERVITFGIKQTLKVTNDLLVLDGFKLFYYGNPSITGIKDIETETLSNEIEGYYNLNGVRISKPVRGITIVKYKDGRCVKVM